MGRTYTATGITFTVNDDTSTQNVEIGTTGVSFDMGEGISWGTPGETANVDTSVSGGVGGTWYTEHNGINWLHHTEDSNYTVEAIDGTIILNIDPVSNTSMIRIMNNTGTIAEIDSSGNMLLAGTIGTNITF